MTATGLPFALSATMAGWPRGRPRQEAARALAVDAWNAGNAAREAARDELSALVALRLSNCRLQAVLRACATYGALMQWTVQGARLPAVAALRAFRFLLPDNVSYSVPRFLRQPRNRSSLLPPAAAVLERLAGERAEIAHGRARYARKRAVELKRKLALVQRLRKAARGLQRTDGQALLVAES